MKFSILALLAATGYVALLIVSFQQPLSLWRYAAMLGWLTVMAYVLMLAFSPMNRFQAIFGRVVAGCVATYLAVTILAWPSPNNTRLGVLPHELLVDYWNTSPFNPLTAVQYTAVYGSPTYAAPAVAYSYPTPGAPAAPTMGYSPPMPTPMYAIAPAAPIYNTMTLEAVAAMNCAILFGFLGGSLAVVRTRRVERLQSRDKRVAEINPLQQAVVSAEGNY